MKKKKTGEEGGNVTGCCLGDQIRNYPAPEFKSCFDYVIYSLSKGAHLFTPIL